jgi:hypothetical protein
MQPCGVGTAADPLHAVVEADRRRREGAEIKSELVDDGCVDAADRRDALRRPGVCAVQQQVESERVLTDVVPVEEALPGQAGDHPER